MTNSLSNKVILVTGGASGIERDSSQAAFFQSAVARKLATNNNPEEE